MAVNDERKAAILERSSGRKLRPDEKTKLNGPPVMLAHAYEDYQDKIDVSKWWYSEKLDGIRAWWDGNNFISRQGNIFSVPDYFKAGMPKCVLDGELYLGKQRFQETMSIVRQRMPDERWCKVTYQIFDLPCVDTKWWDRYQIILDLKIRGSLPGHCQVVCHAPVVSPAHLELNLEIHVREGAEGLMIRNPQALYQAKRSADLLKVKPFKDAEARVIAHEMGKGRHAGRMGGLIVQMPNGNIFHVGTGFSDQDRSNPPAVNDIITYRYTELTRDGIPKCASFLRVRNEP